MKIKSIITLLVLISIPTYSYAAPACLIKNKTAPFLSQYIKDNRLVVKNVTNAIIKEKKKLNDNKIRENNKDKSQIDKVLWNLNSSISKVWTDATNALNETASIFNEMFNFTWYYSYFKYFVTYPISNEVAFQVKRDYTLIVNENKWLLEFIKKMDQNWEWNIKVDEPCKWVVNWLNKCNLELKWKTTKKIIWKLAQNNDIILDFYRSSVIWADLDFSYDDFILVPEDFLTKMKNNYWELSVLKCNEEKDWFFTTIKKAIDDITLINKTSEKWIQKWKDAYALLLWASPGEETKIEKKKLKEYLSNNWIPTDKQDIMLSNLDKYNENKSFSLNNNFVTNTFKSIQNKIQKSLKKWKDENIWNNIPKETKKVSIDKIQTINNILNKNKELQNNITNLYQSEIPFATAWDITTETLRGKIINTHISIQKSIDTLEKTCILSVKVCKEQWWWWNCWSCN